MTGGVVVSSVSVVEVLDGGGCRIMRLIYSPTVWCMLFVGVIMLTVWLSTGGAGGIVVISRMGRRRVKVARIDPLPYY